LSYLLGLDVGTTGVRCVAIDEAGEIRAKSSTDHPSYAPRPGWSEQQPGDWWTGSRLVLSRVAGEVGRDIAGIGLTGQMHGAVFLDRADRVIRPAPLWNDQRTASQCEAITQRVGAERLIEVTGNPALTGFQAPKILWLRDEEPEAYARVTSVLLPKDYIRLLLTGDKASDASDASGTLLLDLRARDWSVAILDALAIPRRLLPEVVESPASRGVLRPDVAAELGLPGGIAIAAGAGDQAAAAVGNGVIVEGLLVCSIGSSGVVFAHSDRPVVDGSGRLHAFCHAVPGAYHIMGVTLAAGASLRWWRDLVGKGTYEELNTLAGQAPPGSEGLLFLPYLSGERTPHLDSRARAAFFGLSARHGVAHLTRAVLEGVAFSLRDSLEMMVGLGIAPTEIRTTGGGARSPLWRQILADVLNRPIVRPVADQGPAFGAALLAGVAAGVYGSVADACSRIRMRAEATLPDPSRVSTYDHYYGSYRDLYASTSSTMHDLSELANRMPD